MYKQIKITNLTHIFTKLNVTLMTLIITMWLPLIESEAFIFKKKPPQPGPIGFLFKIAMVLVAIALLILILKGMYKLVLIVGLFVVAGKLGKFGIILAFGLLFLWLLFKKQGLQALKGKIKGSKSQPQYSQQAYPPEYPQQPISPMDTSNINYSTNQWINTHNQNSYPNDQNDPNIPNQ